MVSYGPFSFKEVSIGILEIFQASWLQDLKSKDYSI